MPRRFLTIGLVLLVAACATTQEPAPLPTTTTGTASTTTTTDVSTTTTRAATTITLAPLGSLAYEPVAEMNFPIHLVPWTPGFEMIATKDGRVWLYDGSQVSETPVLDITDQVRNEGERGLLALAVHPTDSNRVFLHYSANDGDTVVSEFTWDNGALVDEEVLLRHDQPASNHNGGMLQFGPDGLLYLGLGDGGGANDQFGNGQNPNTLLAGLVAIDIDGGADPVKVAFGLRNPWRFWIEDDQVYIADVGQNAYEEVTVAPLQPGINYGWPVTEGLHCFRPSSGCDSAGITLPVIEVSHGEAGSCSITGGVVYRGAAIPEIDGHFFYSDLCGGYLRSFRYDGGVTDATDWTGQVGVPGAVVSFGVDGEGEMYVLTTEAVLKVVPVRG
ncbi:MAG: PQQ-dependent sugar dehydrogenase [Actinobacteria bacterium]|nr:PQQ-dependent sugar dehydrogenase [Actinomycetota bacterium]